MIDVNQLRKGTTFTLDSQIYKVLTYQHNKPGRGGATIRVQIRNMRTGANTQMTFNSGDRVQDIRVEQNEVQYLYNDGSFLTFMDLETYEQPQLRAEVFGEDVQFLKENLTLTLNSFEGEIIDYTLPLTADYAVIDAEAAIAGDTANSPTKKVTIETGLQVTVPMFVQTGDTIRVKTEDGTYVTRV